MDIIKKDRDFYRHFADDETCRNYLVQKRWNGTPKCHRCNNTHNNYYRASRKIYKCSACKSEFSVLTGTIFQNTKLPLTDWFEAIFLLVKGKCHDGVSSPKLAEILDIEQRSAWLMLRKIREALKDETMGKVLSNIVETDEAYIGSNPSRDQRLQKRMSEHQLLYGQKYEHLKAIFGMIERDMKQIVLRKFGWRRNCLNQTIAHTLLKKHVTTDSAIYTDEHKGYYRVKEHFACHKVIKKRRQVTKKDKHGKKKKVWIASYVNGKCHVNGIENVWKNFKEMEKGVYKQFSYKHTDGYLDEFSFRWNNSGLNKMERWNKALGLFFGKTATYQELIKWHDPIQSAPWKV